MDYYVVFITAPSEEEAVRIANALVKENLGKCVNIIRDIRSIYHWENKVEDEKEFLMIVKTKKKVFKRLLERVKELHSYSVPEIIALPIIEGSEDYLHWLDEL